MACAPVLDVPTLRRTVLRVRLRPLLLMLPVLLAGCAVASKSSNPPAPAPETLAKKLLPASEDVQLLRSGTRDELIAVSCTGVPSLRVPADLAFELPDGVTRSGDLLQFPAGDDGFTLQPLDGGEPVLVRCLPEGFPRIETTGRFSDWLVTTTMPTQPGGLPYRMVLEPNGFPAWFQQVEGSLADMILDAGELLVFSAGRRPINSFTNVDGLGFHRLTFDGTKGETWIPKEGVGLDNHAAQVMPNGSLLALRYELADAPLPALGKLPALTQEGVGTCPEIAPGKSTRSLRGRVVEVSPKGVVLNQWAFEDRLPDAPVSAEWVNIAGPGGGLDCVVDAEHLNAAAFYQDPEARPGVGRVLVTGRHTDSATMISWPDGAVLWTLGGHRGEKGLELLEDQSGSPVHPHDANMLDAEHMLIFDNRINEPTRAVIYRIDESARTATLVSSVAPQCPQGPCSSFAMGSSRTTRDRSGLLLGMGTGPVTAFEFQLDGFTIDPSPRASLVLEDAWAYRVLPAPVLDAAKLFAAQNRMRR